jgi:hypothetical protein
LGNIQDKFSTNNDRGVLRMLIKVYFKVRIVMNQGTFGTR